VAPFPEVDDVGFTAKMEGEVDDIAGGQPPWVAVVREFYDPFHADVERAAGKIAHPTIYLDELCPLCPEEGREPGRLMKKLGRYGMFIGCEKYPECRYTRPLEGDTQTPQPVLLDETCPLCGRQLQQRTGRYGPFVGCSGYPECKYIKKAEPKRTGVTCPKCKQGELVERMNRFGRPFYSCDRYPDCDFAVSQQPRVEPCTACGGLVVAARGGAWRCTSCERA